MKKLPLLLSLAMAFALPAHAIDKPVAKTARASAADSRALASLMQDYYQEGSIFEPLGRTFSGDPRFDDQLGMSIDPKVRASHFNALRQFGKRLHAIKPARLDRADRLNYDILDYAIATSLRAEPFPDYLMPVGASGGMPTTMATLASGDSMQPFGTPQQYRAYLNRLHQLTDWIGQAMTNMREGVKLGIVPSKPLIVTALPKFDKLIAATPEQSLYYAPIKKLPDTFTDADKRDLTAAYRAEIVERLDPALRKLAAFMKDEYLPAGRESAGYGTLPNGQAWYAARVAASTTTSMSPEEIHALGLREVARIQGEFGIVGPRMGYNGPAAGLPKWVAAQPQYMPFKKEQEIIDFYKDLDVRLAPKLATIFSLIPKAPLEQRLEPELTRASASDHYTGPSADGKRPGIFWSVVNDPTTYNSTQMTTLYMHEGRPGHHFQIALALEQPLPDFRKYSGYTVYSEGWALYAETLGKELGMFDAPDQYFGHLNDELLRAARLVVDTGLHTKGWTREQTIAYLRENLGYGELEAKIAAERYMGGPGQALAYKIGSLKIQELRQRATTALGAKFKLADFHRVVLEDGGMPLAVLEKKVDRWIAEKRRM